MSEEIKIHHMEIGELISGVCEGLRMCEGTLRGMYVWVISTRDGRGRVAIFANSQLDRRLCTLVGESVNIVRLEDVQTRAGFRALSYAVRIFVPTATRPVGTVGVATDATLTDNGTIESPLHVVPPATGTVGVATDATLTNNETTRSHLHVVPPEIGTVANDRARADSGREGRLPVLSALLADEDSDPDDLAAQCAAQRRVADLDGLTEDQCRARWIQNRIDVEAGRSPGQAMTPAQVAAAKQCFALTLGRDRIIRERLRLLRDQSARRERDQVRVDLEFEPWE